MLRAICLLVCVGSMAACAATTEPERRGRRLTGTCEGACGYYQSCRGDQAGHGVDDVDDVDDVLRECIVDCRDIFIDDGVPDRRNLRGLESLECPELVLFIEGDSGRVPGAPPPTPDTTASHAADDRAP